MKGEAGFPSPLESLQALRRFNEDRQNVIFCRLFSRFRHRDYGDEGTAVGFGAEFHAAFSLGEISSSQHQVFGRFTGEVGLDDGSRLAVRDLIGFAEEVKNRW